MYYFLIFNSIHTVFKAEKMLKECGFEFQIHPTPTEFTASCGISLRFDADNFNKDSIYMLLSNHHIPFQIFNK